MSAQIINLFDRIPQNGLNDTQIIHMLLDCGVLASRFKLFFKQRGVCHWCKCQMTLPPGEATSVSQDHIIPKSQGGSNHISNLVAACTRCNNLRQHLSAEQFTELLKMYDYKLPEWKSHRYRQLQGAINKFLDGRTDFKIRVPARKQENGTNSVQRLQVLH